ncbi:MAG: CAP domain-containing protein [Methylococcales bacterium]|nr:CAP domain-containing protein [Methylococcales bacterium]
MMQRHTLSALSAVLFTTSAMAFDYGDPSNNEQAHLEMLNRARAAPLTEAQRLQIDLFEGVPSGSIQSTAVQPLSSNALLLSIAKNHSADMLKQGYFAHNDLTGLSPFARMSAVNYAYQTAGENIAWQGTTGAIDQAATALKLHDSLFIDKDVSGRGHRVNILNAAYREVGVGLAFGTFSQSGYSYNAGMVTTDFGTRSSDKPIILGVVYNDKNSDQFYTAGEGLANIAVALSASNSTQTASAGGYGLEVTPNSDYTLNFSHPNYGTFNKTVHVDNLNVKVDVLSSAFSNTVTANQCASFVQTKLSIPCITVAGSVLSAELVVVNNTPLQFALQSSAFSNQTATSQCATYNSQTATATLNCVTVGNARYWAELTLKTTASVFELGAFGLAQ